MTATTGAGNVPGSKGFAFAEVVTRTCDTGLFLPLFIAYLTAANVTLPGGATPAAFVTAVTVPAKPVVTLIRFDKSVRFPALAYFAAMPPVAGSLRVQLPGTLFETRCRAPPQYEILILFILPGKTPQVPPPGSIAPPSPPPAPQAPNPFSAEVYKISTAKLVPIIIGCVGGVICLLCLYVSLRARRVVAGFSTLCCCYVVLRLRVALRAAGWGWLPGSALCSTHRFELPLSQSAIRPHSVIHRCALPRSAGPRKPRPQTSSSKTWNHPAPRTRRRRRRRLRGRAARRSRRTSAPRR